MGGWQKTESLMKILVVDDEKLLVKGIKFNLENEGYTVDSCYDGETAVTMAREGNYALYLNFEHFHSPNSTNTFVFYIYILSIQFLLNAQLNNI